MEIPEAESPSQSHGAAASSYQGSNQELSSWDAGKGPSGEDSNEEGPAGKTNSGETKLHPEPLACPEFLWLSYWWSQSSRGWKMSLKSWNGGAELTPASLSLWAPVKTAFTGTRAYGGDLSGSSRYHCVPMASFQRSANSCWELSLVLPQRWSNPPIQHILLFQL